MKPPVFSMRAFHETTSAHQYRVRRLRLAQREVDPGEFLRDLPEPSGGVLILCFARDPGGCRRAPEFPKRNRAGVASTKSERARRSLPGGKSPCRDLLPKTRGHPG